MSLEKLIESLPPYIERQYSIKEGMRKVGLTIRYSSSMQVWICGYGTIRTRSTEKDKQYVGTGYSVIEAVEDFISKLKNK